MTIVTTKSRCFLDNRRRWIVPKPFVKITWNNFSGMDRVIRFYILIRKKTIAYYYSTTLNYKKRLPEIVTFMRKVNLNMRPQIR